MAVKDAVLHALEQARGERLSGGSLADALGVSRAAVHTAIGVLRAEGLAIDGVPGEGYRLADSDDSLTAAGEQQGQVLERTKEAMDYFWQIAEAYVRGRYSICRDLIAVLEDTSSGEAPLKSYLPQESYTDNGRFSPADRYQEIWDALY